MEGMVNRNVAALARAWCPLCQEQVRRMVFSPHLQIPLCVQLPAIPMAAGSGTLYHGRLSRHLGNARIKSAAVPPTGSAGAAF